MAFKSGTVSLDRARQGLEPLHLLQSHVYALSSSIFPFIPFHPSHSVLFRENGAHLASPWSCAPHTIRYSNPSDFFPSLPLL